MAVKHRTLPRQLTPSIRKASPPIDETRIIKQPNVWTAPNDIEMWKRIASRVSDYPPIVPMQFTGEVVKNLIYHIFPVRGDQWRWNVDQLLRRIDLFNGKRIIGISYDDRTDNPEVVMEKFDGHGCKFIVKVNEECGEYMTFPDMLVKVASMDQNEVTFYGHAKGVRYEPDVMPHIRRWCDVQYHVCLDNFALVREHLKRYPLTGPFKKIGRHPAHFMLEPYHYSGTFFWIRNAMVFDRNIFALPKCYSCVEMWPGIYFRETDTGCLFMRIEGYLPENDPYNPDFWTRKVDPSLMKWDMQVR